MNKNKYYRVREIQASSGKTVFIVEACETWLGLLFGFDLRYTLENKTLEEAKYHIDCLVDLKIMKTKTVFKRKVLC